MKKAAFIILLLCLVFPNPILAHELKQSGTVGVTIHVDPDDEPVAGQPANFFLELADTSGKISNDQLDNCDCKINILQNGKLIAGLDFVKNNKVVGVAYTFPEPGGYTIQVTGTPIEGRTFTPFEAGFDYYAKPNPQATPDHLSQAALPANSNSLQPFFPYVMLISGVLILAFFALPKIFPKK